MQGGSNVVGADSGMEVLGWGMDIGDSNTENRMCLS